MKGLVVKKSLIGKQDLLLGRQSETQQRGGGLVNIDGIQYIYPARTLSELKDINPKEFETAFLFGENTLDMIDPEFQLLDAHINEFYYFDFTSTTDERLPDIVKSNKQEFGRWILSRVGEKRLYRLAVPLVKEVIETKTPDIVKQIQDGVSDTITEKIDTGLKVIKKQGLLFDKALEYENGDITKILVKTPEGVQQKSYILNNKDNQKVTIPPLANEASSIGGVPVYVDSTNALGGWLYLPSYNQAVKNVTNTNQEAGLDIFKNVTAQPVGDIRIRIFDSTNSIYSQFDVEFAGFALDNFKIKNVFYTDAVKANPPRAVTLDDLVWYPGFCISANSDVFRLSFLEATYVHRIEVDYRHCSVEPLCVYTDEVTLSNYNYAVRDGGGSYIKNLGQVFNYFWGESQYGINRQFRLFMLGQIEWVTNLTLNKDIYHQYFKYVGEMGDPNIDVSDAFLRNIGMFESKPSQLVMPQLPNITGDFSSAQGNWFQWKGGDQSAVIMGTPRRTTGAFVDKYGNHQNGGFGDSSASFRLDASQVSHVYSDRGDVRPKCVTTILALQVF